MLNCCYSLLLVTVRRCTFGIMSTHVHHLTYLMRSEVTVTKSSGYQQLSIMPNALIEN